MEEPHAGMRRRSDHCRAADEPVFCLAAVVAEFHYFDTRHTPMVISVDLQHEPAREEEGGESVPDCQTFVFS